MKKKNKRIAKNSIICVFSLILITEIAGTTIGASLHTHNVKTSVTLIEPSDTNVLTVSHHGNGMYTTIKEAITNAPDHAVIHINNGTYSEIITINKPLTLEGNGIHATLINPVSEKNKYAIYVGTPHVTIRNMSITNGGNGLYTMGIQVTADHTHIEHCDISDVPVGIAIWSSHNRIQNCTFFRNNDEGIALLGSTHHPVKNNIISYCDFQHNTDGIELQYSSHNQITHCRFINNSHDGVSAIASANNNNTMKNCVARDNAVHNFYFSDSSSGNTRVNCSTHHDFENTFSVFTNDDVIQQENKQDQPETKKRFLKIIKVIANMLPKKLSSRLLLQMANTIP